MWDRINFSNVEKVSDTRWNFSLNCNTPVQLYGHEIYVPDATVSTELAQHVHVANMRQSGSQLFEDKGRLFTGSWMSLLDSLYIWDTYKCCAMFVEQNAAMLG